MFADPMAEPRRSAVTAMWQAASASMLAQRGSLLLWTPVCLAAGIGTWFSFTFEPAPFFYLAIAVASLLAAAVGFLSGEALAPLAWAVSLVLLGMLLAGTRAHSVAEPVLGFRYYGPIQGRIVNVDRSVSDKVRLTLDRVVLKDMRPGRTPTRVRVSLHGTQAHLIPEPGLTVILTGHLSPPSGPVEPGGFDFRRMAWFKGLGAVGYTRTPVLVLAPAEEGRAGLAVFRLRMALSHGIQDRIPGAAGGFAAAILTGDRSGMPREAVDALRNTNTAHLLAISGLHMGLLTGVVFATIRLCLVLVPWFALRYPVRKFAAIGALLVGALYLALSGGAVSTTRAYVMVGVMFGAVLLERRAVSLRSVSIAATILLVISPEALFGPGFQMSFAATTALVAVFGLLRDHRERLPRMPNWVAPVTAVVISSAVAGAATAPFGAAHFNRIADYGLLANLLSVPLMGAAIMPAAVLAALLWPLGLSWIGLGIMRWGLEWILFVARTISAQEGAVTHVITPAPVVLPLLSLGFLFLLLWKGPLRLIGVAAMLAALVIWVRSDRPEILIADTGGLVGILGPEGRALSKPRGDGFAASNWLENDGDGTGQKAAAARPGFVGEKPDRRAQVHGLALRHVTGKGGLETLDGTCGAGIIVANKDIPTPLHGPCTVFDPAALRRTGAVAIRITPDGPRIRTVSDATGQRLWAPGR